jgi:hypothetical protein
LILHCCYFVFKEVIAAVLLSAASNSARYSVLLPKLLDAYLKMDRTAENAEAIRFDLTWRFMHYTPDKIPAAAIADFIATFRSDHLY